MSSIYDGEVEVGKDLVSALAKKGLAIATDKDGNPMIQTGQLNGDMGFGTRSVNVTMVVTDEKSPLYKQLLRFEAGYDGSRCKVTDVRLATETFGSGGVQKQCARIDAIKLDSPDNKPITFGAAFRDEFDEIKKNSAMLIPFQFADAADAVHKQAAEAIQGRAPIAFERYEGYVRIKLHDAQNPHQVKAINVYTELDGDHLKATGIMMTSDKDGKLTNTLIPLPAGYKFYLKDDGNPVSRWLDHEASLKTAEAITKHVTFKLGGKQPKQYEMHFNPDGTLGKTVESKSDAMKDALKKFHDRDYTPVIPAPDDMVIVATRTPAVKATDRSQGFSSIA